MKRFSFTLLVIMLCTLNIFGKPSQEIILNYGLNEISIEIQNESDVDLESLMMLSFTDQFTKGFEICKKAETNYVKSNKTGLKTINILIKVNETVAIGNYKIPFTVKDKENHIWSYSLTASVAGGNGLNKSLDENKLPKQFSLNQNYPNPFNQTTHISFSIPELRQVTLIIYNMLGEEIKSLVNRTFEPGIHTVTWNGENEFGKKVCNGIYFYRLKTKDNAITKKLILLIQRTRNEKKLLSTKHLQK